MYGLFLERVSLLTLVLLLIVSRFKEKSKGCYKQKKPNQIND